MGTIKIKFGDLKALIRETAGKIEQRMPPKSSEKDGEQRKKLPTLKKESEELDELEESVQRYIRSRK